MNCACRVGVALLLVALAASSARAESATFGLVAGADAATLVPPAPGSGETLTMRPGTVLGFYAVIPILRSVSFEPELLYVPKYTRRTVASADTELRIKYVELPLLAKMPMFWGTYIVEGVSLGFPVEVRGVAPNLEQITSPDIAIVIGGGYDVRKKIAIEFRYEGGLRRAVTLDTAPVQRTRAYMILAKLHF